MMLKKFGSSTCTTAMQSAIGSVLATAAAGMGEESSAPTDSTTMTAARRMMAIPPASSTSAPGRISSGNTAQQRP